MRALAAPLDSPAFEPVVYGPADVLQRAAELVGVPVPADIRDCSGRHPGGPLPEVEALETAVRDCLAGECAALVTAPIHKARLLDGGFPYMGHTEFLAARCNRDVVMAFGGGKLRVALLTVHIPLADVPGAIRPEDVVRVAGIFADGLRQFFDIDSPRLALCGLNPHAGESGKMGSEEDRFLAPGVELARAKGIQLSDPLPADTVFTRALRGDFDGVLACYHDQGLAPLKAIDFGRSVNITMGLPFVRTSPDHGTANDIAWTGRADPSSMISALGLAARCVGKRRGER